jgi:hypothetical protein
VASVAGATASIVAPNAIEASRPKRFILDPQRSAEHGFAE